MIRIITRGLPEAARNFDEEGGRMLAALRVTFAAASLQESNYLRSDRMTGGGPSNLRVRTGALRASTRPLPVRADRNTVQSGVQFGTVYAATHIGKRGTKTTITPKGHPFLAIPLDAAKTTAGVARGGPDRTWQGQYRMNSPFSGTFIHKGIIFGRVGRATAVAGKTDKRAVVPLFVLKRSVQIPVRIPVEGILERLEDSVVSGLEKSA